MAPVSSPMDRPLLLGLPAWTWALIGLLLGLASTGAVLLLERHNLEAEARLQLAQIAKRSAYQIERQFEGSGLLLRAMQSAYFVNGDIDQPLFSAIQSNLRSARLSQSLVVIGFAPRTPGPPGERARYIYARIAPVAGNMPLLGLDVAGQAANLHALERARDIDEPVMSAAFPLMQSTPNPDDALGVVIRLPVFTPGLSPRNAAERRQRELGSLGLSMRVRPLLLGALPAEALAEFRVRVVDVTDGRAQPLYDSGTQAVPDAPAYGGVLSFGQRRWQLLMQPRMEPYNSGLLWMVGIGGLIASLLLASLFWSIANTRRRAVGLGRQMSARYRESEERFRKLNDLLPALVLMARAEDGHVLYANQAACARLGERINTRCQPRCAVRRCRLAGATARARRRRLEQR